MGVAITVVVLIFLVIVVVNLVRRILYMGRDVRNQFRSAFGKNSAELDKANHILAKASKNGLILKWATEDAYKTLLKYYEANSALDYIATYMRQYGLNRVDVPRNFYMEPGSSMEVLKAMCVSHFNKFDFSAMDKDGMMSEKDFTTFCNLAYMWYFADENIRTFEEAQSNVRNVFGEYCENNPNSVIGE